MFKINENDFFLESDSVLDRAYEQYRKERIISGKKPLSKAEWKKRIYIASGIGTIGLTGKKTKEMISGRSRYYHGARNIDLEPSFDMPLGFIGKPHARTDSIYKNGLKKDYGGTGVSALDDKLSPNRAANGKGWADDSKGKIHLTKNKNNADRYGLQGIPGYVFANDLNQKGQKNEKGEMYTKDNIGHTFEIDLDYDKVKKLKRDEKVPLGQHLMYHKGYIGSIDVDPEEIRNNPYVSKEKKKEYDKKKFKNYVKNHPGRFAGGVALGAAATSAAGFAAYKIIKNNKEQKKAYEEYKRKGGKEDFKTFKKYIMKECYEYIFENYDLILEDDRIILDEYDYQILNSMI